MNNQQIQQLNQERGNPDRFGTLNQRPVAWKTYKRPTSVKMVNISEGQQRTSRHSTASVGRSIMIIILIDPQL